MTTFKEAFGGPRKSIYLNNASTTKMHPDVVWFMNQYNELCYGNASDHNELGYLSRQAIDISREKIAASINCSPDEVYFTSGGTEANNTVIKGLKNKYHFHPAHIISSNIEHHSIIGALESRSRLHNDIEYNLVPVENSGVMDVTRITDAFKLHTDLVSIMTVNNELGTIQPIQKIAEKCQDNGIIFHTDAVQAYGHMKIDVSALGIDLMSVSGHKFHGPKGVGFLYMSNRVKNRFEPLLSGGQQERYFRASTENIPGIAGLGAAAKIAMDNMNENEAHEKMLKNILEQEIKRLNNVHVNGKINYTDSRHLNIRVDGCRGEELQALFNEQRIYISTGSACNSQSGEPSHVLKAIGLSDDEANSSIRISLGDLNTKEDIETFIYCLKQNIEILRGRT